MSDAGKNGLVIWEGKSLIDKKPIILVATGFKRTNNPKTGKMIGTWILCRDTHPAKVFESCTDFSICGDCKHSKQKTCYVNVYHAPSRVWEAYKRGAYSNVDWYKFYNKSVRIGSYGDPAAVPFEVWDMMVRLTNGFTSYTHQWKRCDDRLKNICMASVETKHEYKVAKEKGWRTTRVILKNETLFENEIVCPANKGDITCKNCNLCSGLSSKSKKDVVIYVHGSSGKATRFIEIARLRKNKKGFSHLLKRSPVKV